MKEERKKNKRGGEKPIPNTCIEFYELATWRVRIYNDSVHSNSAKPLSKRVVESVTHFLCVLVTPKWNEDIDILKYKSI